MNKVQEQFANALGADDFIQRVEMALYAFGFNGDNSIGGSAAAVTDAEPAWLRFTAGHRDSTINLGALLFAHSIRKLPTPDAPKCAPLLHSMLQPW